MPLFKSPGKVEKTGRKRKLAFLMELCGNSVPQWFSGKKQQT